MHFITLNSLMLRIEDTFLKWKLEGVSFSGMEDYHAIRLCFVYGGGDKSDMMICIL